MVAATPAPSRLALNAADVPDCDGDIDAISTGWCTPGTLYRDEIAAQSCTLSRGGRSVAVATERSGSQ